METPQAINLHRSTVAGMTVAGMAAEIRKLLEVLPTDKWVVQYADGENWTEFAETKFKMAAEQIASMLREIGYTTRISRKVSAWDFGPVVAPAKVPAAAPDKTKGSHV